MVEVASIVLAVIALITSTACAGITLWGAYLSDKRKNQRESQALIAKYGDPVLLAAQDLQSRLYNLTDWTVTSYLGSKKEENLLLYTAFVLGQYFAWTHILRLKTQFLRLKTDNANRRLTEMLTSIMAEFGTDKHGEDGSTFMLWRGDQMAIGQVMTVEYHGELCCMGYAEFRRKSAEDGLDVRLKDAVKGITFDRMATWPGGGRRSSSNAMPEVRRGSMQSLEVDPEQAPAFVKMGNGEFRRWFGPILKDIISLAEAKQAEANADDSSSDGSGNVIADQRLRRLQHRLIELIRELDPKGLRSEAKLLNRCHRATVCKCSECERRTGITGPERCGCKKCSPPPAQDV